MLDLVGNPEDLFSRVAAQIIRQSISAMGIEKFQVLLTQSMM